jgi:hypothetical protein
MALDTIALKKLLSQVTEEGYEIVVGKVQDQVYNGSCGGPCTYEVQLQVFYSADLVKLLKEVF